MRAVLFLIAVLALSSAAVASYLLLPAGDGPPEEKEGLRGAVRDEPEPAPAFTLTDQNGEAFTLNDTRGRVSLLFFGYSHCPDACPTAILKYRYVQNRLGENADRVNFIFITVDPERGDPETLRSYIDRVKLDMKYLTGDPDALRAVWDAYHIYREKTPLQEEGGGAERPGEDYLVDHTALIFVIDKEMNLRESFTLIDSNEEILADVELLLEEEL